MGNTQIYVREGNEYIGPFLSRDDAHLFLILVELFEGNIEGIGIVELDAANRSDAEEDVCLQQCCCAS